MLTSDQRAVAAKILRFYGHEAQTAHAIQELAELIAELTRFGRAEAKAGEVADVYIMLAQIVLAFDMENAVKEQIVFKLTRQEGRMNSAIKRAETWSEEDR
jgi:hypothetical protein